MEQAREERICGVGGWRLAAGGRRQAAGEVCVCARARARKERAAGAEERGEKASSQGDGERGAEKRRGRWNGASHGVPTLRASEGSRESRRSNPHAFCFAPSDARDAGAIVESSPDRPRVGCGSQRAAAVQGLGVPTSNAPRGFDRQVLANRRGWGRCGARAQPDWPDRSLIAGAFGEGEARRRRAKRSKHKLAQPR
jgi:hypothetical protein